jgi:hypothetical protein
MHKRADDVCVRGLQELRLAVVFRGDNFDAVYTIAYGEGQCCACLAAAQARYTHMAPTFGRQM